MMVPVDMVLSKLEATVAMFHGQSRVHWSILQYEVFRRVCMEILMPVATVSSLSATVDVIFLPLAKCAICYLVYKKTTLKLFWRPFSCLVLTLLICSYRSSHSNKRPVVIQLTVIYTSLKHVPTSSYYRKKIDKSRSSWSLSMCIQNNSFNWNVNSAELSINRKFVWITY